MPADADLDTCRKAFLNGELSPTPWAKLYKRQLLTDEVFNFPREIDGEEDMIMNTRLFFKTSVPPKVLYKHVYNFRRNTASVSHTKKASVSHEEAFYRALYDSIPQGERSKYMSQIVFLKLNGLFPIAFHNPLAVASDKSGYITTLREEVWQFDYRPSLKERVLLYSRSTAVLKLTGFCELLRRFLKYHLS